VSLEGSWCLLFSEGTLTPMGQKLSMSSHVAGVPKTLNGRKTYCSNPVLNGDDLLIKHRVGKGMEDWAGFRAMARGQRFDGISQASGTLVVLVKKPLKTGITVSKGLQPIWKTRLAIGSGGRESQGGKKNGLSNP